MGSRRGCKFAREMLRFCGVGELERRVASYTSAENKDERSGKGREESKKVQRLLR